MEQETLTKLFELLKDCDTTLEVRITAKNNSTEKLPIQSEETASYIESIENANQQLHIENEKLEEVNKKLIEEIKSFEDINNALIKKINLAKKVNDALEMEIAKYKLAQNMFDIYEEYKQLPESLRSSLHGLIYEESPITFTMSLATQDKLQRFFDKIITEVTKNEDEIISQGTFTENLKMLAKVFEFFYENYLIKASNVNCRRIDTLIGTDFESGTCHRVGKHYGKIKEVLIQGYFIDNKQIESSIVLVEDF